MRAESLRAEKRGRKEMKLLILIKIPQQILFFSSLHPMPNIGEHKVALNLPRKSNLTVLRPFSLLFGKSAANSAGRSAIRESLIYL